MEIKIDTKSDSKEDIKKAIEFLKTLVSENVTPSEVKEGAFNIFDAGEQKAGKDDTEEVPEYDIRKMVY